jgi:HEPN domain-containing protein
MKPTTREWVAKAEQDFSAASGLARRKRPTYDTVCFLCQQCVEKYLKARLNEAGLTIPRTHDCAALLSMLLRVEPLWEPFDSMLRLLSAYAVKFRYPGHNAAKQDAQQALRDCRVLRKEIRRSLGLAAK